MFSYNAQEELELMGFAKLECSSAGLRSEEKIELFGYGVIPHAIIYYRCVKLVNRVNSVFFKKKCSNLFNFRVIALY
jgi:hypothetical protein